MYLVAPLRAPGIGDVAQWSNCLTGSGENLAVNWMNIAVAGGSECSGQAAYFGHAHAVDRVVMFSGIDDATEYNLAQVRAYHFNPRFKEVSTRSAL